MYRPGEAYPFTPIYPAMGPAPSTNQQTPAEGGPTPADEYSPQEPTPIEGSFEGASLGPDDASMQLPPGAKILSRGDRVLQPGETPPPQVQQASRQRNVRSAQYQPQLRRGMRR